MKTFLNFILLLLCLSYSWDIFALEIKCPVIPWDYSNEVISNKIQECLDKRAKKQESSITEFYCPSGDYTLIDGKPLDDSTIPYHIGSALLMTQVDEDALSYMCMIRESRKQDAVAWTEDMRKAIEIMSENSFGQRFLDICTTWYVESHINTDTKTWISNTDTYPQSICREIAIKKAQAWYNVAKILMGEWIAKGNQNDKDVFMNTVKGKYSKIIDKFLLYARVAWRTIKNLTALPKETIRK